MFAIAYPQKNHNHWFFPGNSPNVINAKLQYLALFDKPIFYFSFFPFIKAAHSFNISLSYLIQDWLE